MYVYNKQLLLPAREKDRLWSGQDSNRLFQANLERQPADWYYRSHAVEYTWNSNGYRAPEWEKVNWDHSHIVMGCSYVVGVGLTDTDTLPSRLSTELNEPVVNLGYGGGGVGTVVYNSLRLIDADIRPLSVTLVIPNLFRLTIFQDNKTLHLLPSGDAHSHADPFKNFYETWISTGPNAEMYSLMLMRGAIASWANVGVTVVVKHWSHEVDYDWQNLGPNLPSSVDYARDLQPNQDSQFGHPGRKTMQIWANIIADEIKTKRMN
jgi:hypothetical protein